MVTYNYGCMLSMFQNMFGMGKKTGNYIRRAIPTYQGGEEIPEEIIPLLWHNQDEIPKNKCGINYCLD